MNIKWGKFPTWKSRLHKKSQTISVSNNPKKERKNYLKDFQFRHLRIIIVTSGICCSAHHEGKILSNPAVKLQIKQ